MGKPFCCSLSHYLEKYSMTQRTIIYGFTGVGLGLALGFATLSWSVNGATAVPRQTPQEDKPIEQTRKNIQVLKGLPESQLFLAMNFVGDSLGVHCDYCHVKNGKNPQTGVDNWIWDSDAKQKKIVARDMMRMVLDLNRTKFNNEALVTCYTCHRGSTAVERMAPLPPRDFAKEALQSLKTALPSAQEIVNKYFSAVRAGPPGSLSQTIVMMGTAERSSG